jgi:lipid-A-disaccharide synthase
MQDRMVVPECLQENCTPEKLARGIHELLASDTVRKNQIDGLDEVASWLGQGQFVPSERAAETVLDVVGSRTKSKAA